MNDLNDVSAILFFETKQKSDFTKLSCSYWNISSGEQVQNWEYWDVVVIPVTEISGSAGLKQRSSMCHWAPLVSLRLLVAEVINVPAANQNALSLTFGPP